VSEDYQSFGSFGTGIRLVQGRLPWSPQDGTGPRSRAGPGGLGSGRAGSRSGSGSGQGLAGTAYRPRAIAALAIAVQAASVGAPLGRLSVDLRAYTVNR
jgi:hypothetical protein